MKPKTKGAGFRSLLVMLCSVAIIPGDTFAFVRAGNLTQTPAPAQKQTQNPASAPTAASKQAAPGEPAEKIPPDQLDSLVAPIALYPDPLLAQTLAASTYPLEIVQLQQWLVKNKNLKDKALADAVAKQPWDPSVQAMAALPDVVKRLADDIQWTTDLGNAFLAQQSDVMDAVQRMRKKAQDKGNLKTSEQQKVETKVVENKSVIVVEQADPQVVYVPSYNPVVVYGAPVYAYPPIYYPPPGYYAAGMAISFGVGVAMGAAWGGGWGWGAGWGNNDIQINNYNNFNRNANVNRGTRNVNRTGTWNHNPQHRGGAPYRDRATANRYGGTTSGTSLANRQAGARQQVNRQGGNLQSTRAAGGAGLGNSGGAATARSASASGGGLSNRDPSGGASGAASTRSASASGDRIGNRTTSGGSSGGTSAFSGARESGARAQSASSRGASSMGARSGGFSRSGGGARGGGGRRR
jgi:Protein of unknown function (DUF3300)